MRKKLINFIHSISSVFFLKTYNFEIKYKMFFCGSLIYLSINAKKLIKNKFKNQINMYCYRLHFL